MSAAKLNLRFLPIYAAFRCLEPLFPLYVIFASFYHLSYSQIFTTQIIFSLCVICCDLPFGILGDLLGKEKLLRFGSFCYLMAVLLLLQEPGFLHFFFSEGLLGLAFASFSGADTSLLFQSCEIENCSYASMESRVQSLALGAAGVSNILGALLALISIPALAVGSVCIALFRLLISYRLCGIINPPLERNLLFAFKQQCAQIFKGFKSELPKANGLLFIYSGLLGAIMIMNYWMMQIFLKELHLDISWIALITFCYFLSAAFAAKQAKLIQNHERFLFVIIPALLSITLLVLSFQKSLWALPIFLCAGMAFGIKMPFIYQQLHQLSADEIRTSFLSFDNVATRLSFCLISYPIARVIDQMGLANAYMILLGLLLLVLIMGIYLAKYKPQCTSKILKVI